jgi:hypothetical protein
VYGHLRRRRRHHRVVVRQHSNPRESLMDRMGRCRRHPQCW